MITYEELLVLAHDLPRAASDDLRRVMSCEAKGTVKLARTPHGRIEIFLEGAPLTARFHRVQEALEYQKWYREDGTEFFANRILLPAAGHFEQVAAFLCTELLRNGATTDVKTAFSKTEPLIELAIADLLIADETLVGLCGEMLVLRSLLLAANRGQTLLVLESWKGHRETARDFQFSGVGIEVKTTTGRSSSHQFNGVHQLEVGHGVDGIEEWNLILASIGIEWVALEEQEDTFSLPGIVNDIVRSIRDALGDASESVVDGFLNTVASYGARSKLGYDHRLMAESSRFSRGIRITFARGYDLTDDRIHLLSSDDLRSRPFIDAESISFRVSFPEVVTGDLNPIVGLSKVARKILDQCSWSE